MIMEGVGQLDYGLRWVEVESVNRCELCVIVLFSGLRSFLVLTATSAPDIQARNPAILPLSNARRPHHKPPLRGGRLR